MGSGAKSASGVRYLRRSMNMRNLNRGAENEQQSAKNAQSHPPGVS
jgi:hypothetical protein